MERATVLGRNGDALFMLAVPPRLGPSEGSVPHRVLAGDRVEVKLEMPAQEA